MYYLPNFSDKMPQHKEVKKLLDIAIYHIKTLVKNEAVRVSRIINYKFVHLVSDDYEQKISENHAIETYLKKQIEAFKEHVFTHIPARKHLDLQHIPQMIRHCFFKELHKFSNLTTLILGSGSGGWGRSYHYR